MAQFTAVAAPLLSCCFLCALGIECKALMGGHFGVVVVGWDRAHDRMGSWAGGRGGRHGGWCGAIWALRVETQQCRPSHGSAKREHAGWGVRHPHVDEGGEAGPGGRGCIVASTAAALTAAAGMGMKAGKQNVHVVYCHRPTHAAATLLSKGCLSLGCMMHHEGEGPSWGEAGRKEAAAPCVAERAAIGNRACCPL